jgi:hypothetical protein
MLFKSIYGVEFVDQGLTLIFRFLGIERVFIGRPLSFIPEENSEYPISPTQFSDSSLVPHVEAMRHGDN